MQRKENNKPSKQTRHGEASKASDGDPSVHRRNLELFAYPIIFLFTVFRHVLYRLFLIFKSIGSLAGRARFAFRQQQEPLHVDVPATEVEAETSDMTTRHQPGPGDPLLAKQKHHHRRAFEYISKALKIDEENEGHKDLAIELYKKGITELELGINVDCSGGKGELYERAQRLHEKMKTNLSMAKDRLQFLGKGFSGFVC